ncbi:MAG: PH domain-containing protein [Patescibacteria group bacterium]
MIQLAPNETVRFVIRRHWFVYLGPVFVFLILFAVPPLIVRSGPRYLPLLSHPLVSPVVKFLLALYLLGFLAYVLLHWTKYYLDTWIITDQRLIDIEQHGLFHREISEFPLERVQNVTIEIPGFIATVLKFGNLKIQTASHGEFTITEVPNCYHAKELILKYSRVPRQTIPHEPEKKIMAG